MGYRIEVKVKTTDGSSAYSAATTAKTPMIKSELEQFRDSLNLPDIEKRLEGMSTKNETERKLASLQTLINGIDKRTTALEKTQGLIGVCCPNLRITATGPAKTEQASRLGTYEYFKLGPDGREIFKQTKKGSEQTYLYFSEKDFWTFGEDYTSTIAGIYHKTCKSTCPSSCSSEW